MLRIGIVGSGFGQYGLMPAFRSIKNCEVVAICGTKRPQLVEYCQSIGFTNIYSDWRLMLENENLDALALAVTPAAQYEIAKTAIKKGLHIFAEKPLTVNSSQAKELLKLADQNKIVHGVDFIFPEVAAWAKVKGLLEREVYGKLLHIATNWDFLSYDLKNGINSWKTDPAQGGGALSFYFSHGLYYLEYFAGRILETRSSFTVSPESKGHGEVGVDMILKFERGVSGYAHVSCNSRGLTRHQLIFQFERAVIVLENKDSFLGSFVVTQYTPSDIKKLTVRDQRGEKDEDERVKIVKKMARKFIEACLENKQMVPSFREGLRVQELIEQIRNEQNTLTHTT